MKKWCPVNREAIDVNGNCYCSNRQYSVKLPCLDREPDCYVKEYDNGFTYYGQYTGAYITHGRRRIES